MSHRVTPMKRTRSLWIPLSLLIFVLALLPGLIAQADFGTNWSATLFPSTDLSGAGVSVAGVGQINFNFGGGPPNINGATIANCPSSPTCTDNFSIRFTSSQTFAAGTYQFVVAADDTVRLIVDGNPVINNFNPSSGRPLTTDTVNVTLTAGLHNITVEYNEFIGESIIQVQWFLQGTGGTVVVPTSVGTAVPALSVQVVSVKGLSVRTGPYLGASLVTVARPGTPYTPIARNRDEGQYTWFLITVGDKTGWASGRYLEVTGDPNSVPLQGTVFDQIDNAPGVGVMAVPRSVMNFRRRPSQRAGLISQMPWGAETELIGRTIQAGENFWYQVRWNGQVGWIYAPFVSVRGNIDAVPIR
jgi:uncharacterized protein YraI